MKVKCFECAALLEADDADAAAQAFAVHGREKHTWSYPEEAIRNYARNYGEATIAPPFRRHGVAAALLDRVIADAASRGASWIEGYPHNEPKDSDAAHFRGPRSLYEARGFAPVEVLERYTVVRRSAG